MALTLPTLLEGESQDHPYAWSSVFAAHAWIGLGPWGLLAIYIDMFISTPDVQMDPIAGS